MLKGQVSLDLMLAIIAAVVFFGALVTYFDGLSSNVQHASAQNELKAVLLDVYAATGSVKAYGVSVEYTTPALKNSTLKECTIDVTAGAGGQIVVSPASAGVESESYENIDLSGVQVKNSAGAAITKFGCGETVTITP